MDEWDEHGRIAGGPVEAKHHDGDRTPGILALDPKLDRGVGQLASRKRGCSREEVEIGLAALEVGLWRVNDQLVQDDLVATLDADPNRAASANSGKTGPNVRRWPGTDDGICRLTPSRGVPILSMLLFTCRGQRRVQRH
jgi:hypothetical protein